MRVFWLVVLSLLIVQSQAVKYKITDQIFMDVKINGKFSGTLVVGLFGDLLPKTVKNFKTLALEDVDGHSYVDTNFLISLKKVMVLGGDAVYNNGSGSVSVYGPHFEDESFEISPDSAGLVVMANRGEPNTNGCMFFITTMPMPWIRGKNVVFGKVLKGHEVVHKIEHLPVNHEYKLMKHQVKIARCGRVHAKAFYDEHRNYELTFWAWIKAGWFPLSFSFAILGFFHYFINQLNKYGI